jgi:hypothetical protein
MILLSLLMPLPLGCPAIPLLNEAGSPLNAVLNKLYLVQML